MGTLGRKLAEGAECVKIFGESIMVNAKIECLQGISGHADMKRIPGMAAWFEKKPGEDHGCTWWEGSCDRQLLAELASKEIGCPAFAPYSGGCVDLATNTVITAGTPVPKKAAEKPARARANAAFERGCTKRLCRWFLRMKDWRTKIWPNSTQIRKICTNGIVNVRTKYFFIFPGE